MKKNNIKGFILAEVIVISVVVITALTIIYMQFISVNNSYYRSFRYNTVDDLYAVNNIRSFIEKDNLDNIINLLEGKNYVDLSSCSYEYFLEYNYCKNLLKTLNVKTLLFTYEDVTDLKSELNNISISEGMKSFIKTISSSKNNKYRIIVEFEDDRYATLKLGSFIVSNISNECVKYGNTCTIDQIKSQVSLTVAVNDNESYNFNVLSDDGEKLTLIMDNSFEDDINWSSSLNEGPLNLLEYVETKTKNWVNIPDITYTLSGNSSDDFNSCSVYSECNSNVYSLSTRNAKARLPKLQELTNLGCTQTSGSCPSWLTNNFDYSTVTGFWTSTTSSSNVWIVSYDNRLKENSISGSTIKIKPVIIIYKDVI